MQNGCPHWALNGEGAQVRVVEHMSSSVIIEKWNPRASISQVAHDAGLTNSTTVVVSSQCQQLLGWQAVALTLCEKECSRQHAMFPDRWNLKMMKSKPLQICARTSWQPSARCTSLVFQLVAAGDEPERFATILERITGVTRQSSTGRRRKKNTADSIVVLTGLFFLRCRSEAMATWKNVVLREIGDTTGGLTFFCAGKIAPLNRSLKNAIFCRFNLLKKYILY